MIDYEGNDYWTEPEPTATPQKPKPGLVEKLEAQGFRPHGYEW